MSDSRRVYRAIKRTVMQAYPHKPTGHSESRLNTLAFVVSGIVQGKHCQLPKIRCPARFTRPARKSNCTAG